MAVGLPAKYEEARRFNVHPDYLAPAVAQTIASLGWRVVMGTPYQVQIKFPFNFLSYGENMYITIYQDGTIHARSEGVFSLQWFDWGKNKSNVNKFFMQLMALTGHQPLS